MTAATPHSRRYWTVPQVALTHSTSLQQCPETAMCTSRAVLWLRVPKCASTSIEKTFLQADLLARGAPVVGKLNMVPGGTLPTFFQRYPEFWARAWKFAVVRNPWDRFISGWRYVAPEKPLRELLLNLPLPSETHLWHHVTRSQCEFLVDEQGQLLPDRLLLFEHLQADMDACCDWLGLPRLTLRHDKRGARQVGYRQYYNDETQALDGKIFRQDIERFGYAF